MANKMTATKGTVVTISMEDATTLNNKIVEQNNAMLKKGLALCPLLHTMSVTGGYSLLGYKNIYDYAASTIGRSRGATSQYIQLAERYFSRKKDKPEEVTSTLLPKWKDYSVTQLVEIRSLSDSDIDELGITPDTSIKDIKALVADRKNSLALERKVDNAIKSANKSITDSTDQYKSSDLYDVKNEDTRNQFAAEIQEKESAAAALNERRNEVAQQVCKEVRNLIATLDYEDLETIFESDLTLKVVSLVKGNKGTEVDTIKEFPLDR